VPDRCCRVTYPRQILPGQSYLVTRRTTQRQFLLRPSRVTNQNVKYCLALAAERTGVILHAVCVMSNHWHGVVTDPEARLPEFTECFHKLLAKAQNAAIERWENFWSSDKTSLVLLTSEHDVLEKMAYTLANPTAAGLVKCPDEWPGVISGRFGSEDLVEMPDAFFDEEGDLPENTELQFVRNRSGVDASPVLGGSCIVRLARCNARQVQEASRNRWFSRSGHSTGGVSGGFQRCGSNSSILLAG